MTPFLIVRGAVKAIDWYSQALDAIEITRSLAPDGRVMHGEIRIGNTVVMLCDEFPEMGGHWRSPETLGGTSASMWIYTEDCDAMYSKAIAAGAKSDNPPADMFWGDRYSRITDPFGHTWSIATHTEDVSPEEMQRRETEYASKMAG